eukprot:gene54810-11751_t
MPVGSTPPIRELRRRIAELTARRAVRLRVAPGADEDTVPGRKGRVESREK